MDIWEEKLITEMRQGDKAAFERCYRLLSPQIYTIIYNICRNEASAEELLQDTFLDMFEKFKLFRNDKSLVGWVKQIAFNNTLNFIKRNSRIVFTEIENEVVSLPLELLQIENEQLLESLLHGVSEIERLVLWLFIVEQYTHIEIGEFTDKSESFSKSIVSRSLQKIRRTREAINHA